MGSSRILLEGTAPDSSIEAVVEDDDRVIYLYARELGRKGRLRPVWVRNRIAAPAEVDVHAMSHGQAPLMPVPHCAHPEGAPALDASELGLVWLPAGGGVALFEKGECIAAALPSGPGEELSGHARDARGPGPFARELPAPLSRLFASARDYWRAWDESPNPWQVLQPAQIAQYEEQLGQSTNYYAIDGDVWPPKGMLRIRCELGIALVTIGVALRPQPTMAVRDKVSERLHRIELGIVLPVDTEDGTVRKWVSYVGGQSGLPWARRTWLAPGHTVPCDVESERGVAAVVLADASTFAPHVELGRALGEQVSLLWMVPINEIERERARQHGSQQLIETLALPRRDLRPGR